MTEAATVGSNGRRTGGVWWHSLQSVEPTASQTDQEVSPRAAPQACRIAQVVRCETCLLGDPGEGSIRETFHAATELFRRRSINRHHRSCRKTLLMSTWQHPKRLTLLHALLGLLLIAGVAGAFGGLRFVVHALRHYPSQLIAGSATLLVVAWLGAPSSRDLELRQVSWLRCVGLSLGSFLSGALAAVLVNLALMGTLFRNQDLGAFLFLPLFWLVLIGTPFALAMGSLLWSMIIRFGRPSNRLMQRNRTSASQPSGQFTSDRSPTGSSSH